MQTCRGCGSTKLINDHKQGDVLCPACGLVIAQHEVNCSIQAFDKNKSRQKHESKSKSQEKRGQMSGFRRLNINSAFDQRLAHVRKHIVNIVEQTAVECSSHMTDQAIHLYERLSKTKMTKVKKDELIAATCVFIAFRNSSAPFNFKEMPKYCDNVTKRELARCYKKCSQHLEEHCGNSGSSFKCVPRYAYLLGFKRAEIMFVSRVVPMIDIKCLIRGGNPMSTLAAVIFFCGIKLNVPIEIKKVASVIDVAENTVVKAYKYLIKSTDLFLTKKILKEIQRLNRCPTESQHLYL